VLGGVLGDKVNADILNNKQGTDRRIEEGHCPARKRERLSAMLAAGAQIIVPRSQRASQWVARRRAANSM
jgi:hypothetical protein